MSLILTPDQRAFAIAILVIYGVCTPWVAELLHHLGKRTRRLPFYGLYLSVLAAIAGASLALVDVEARRYAWPGYVLLVVLGFVGAVICLHSERWLVRRLPDRKRSRRASHFPVASGIRTASPAKRKLMLAFLVGIAVCEEVIYRGSLLTLAGSLSPTPVRVFGVVAIAAVFASQHVAFGRIHVFLKVPLSVNTTVLTLVTGSLIPAVVTHAIVNIRAFQLGTDMPVARTYLLPDA